MKLELRISQKLLKEVLLYGNNSRNEIVAEILENIDISETEGVGFIETDIIIILDTVMDPED